MLVARIGYMKFYCGAQAGDEAPRGGGSYPDEEKHERYNFAVHSGRVYGYVQPKGGGVNLARIAPGAQGDELDDVLVVFLGGQTVVGWYRSATVFDRVLHPKGALAKARQHCGYVCTASAADAVLLPTRARSFDVPHGKGGTGTANVTYRFDPSGQMKESPWIDDLLAYVDAYAGPNLIEDPLAEAEDDVAASLESVAAESAGQGFTTSPAVRKAVENRAVALATSHFENDGWAVTPKGKPYDLLCKKGTATLYVEVKGTQLNASQILLTRNEVAFAKKHSDRMALFVASGIKVSQHGKANVKATGGKTQIVKPWSPYRGLLQPITYWYKLEEHD